MSKSLCKKTGFSLIEILVVVTLIGIMAAMVGPNYLKYYQKTNLESTSKLLQSTFYEAFSLSRSRSNHFLVVGTKGNNYVEIMKCDDLACTTSTLDSTFEFLGKNVLKDNDLKVKFLAPQGNIEFPDEANTVVELILKVGDDTLAKEIKIYRESGLIEIPK